jgi:hypothetical protein
MLIQQELGTNEFCFSQRRITAKTVHDFRGDKLFADLKCYFFTYCGSLIESYRERNLVYVC